MVRFETGNAFEKSAINADGTRNGWFVGSRRFIEGSELRQNEQCEIKWSTHPAGYDSGSNHALVVGGYRYSCLETYGLLFEISQTRSGRKVG